MFAAKRRSEIRDDDMNVFSAQVKCAYEFGAMPKGVLRAGPDGQFAIGPFGDSRPRFQRSMLDVGDVEILAQHLFGGGQVIGEGICRDAALRMLLEIIVKRRAGRMRRLHPLGRFRDGCERSLGFKSTRRGHTDELLVLEYHDVFHRLPGTQLNRD